MDDEIGLMKMKRGDTIGETGHEGGRDVYDAENLHTIRARLSSKHTHRYK